MVNFALLKTDFPQITNFDIRLRSFWYGIRQSGDITIEFQTFLGGTMQQSGTDFINIGGQTVQTSIVLRNASKPDRNIVNDPDGDEMGVLRYNTFNKSGQIIDPI